MYKRQVIPMSSVTSILLSDSVLSSWIESSFRTSDEAVSYTHLPCAAVKTTIFPTGIVWFTLMATPRAEASIFPSRLAPLKQASKKTVIDFDGELPKVLYKFSNE